jgi:hypothetical protein
MGNLPSYVWRSFMATQPVLQNGLIWRVGDGNNIGIWNDKWVPKPSTHKIQSPRVELGSHARVAEIIDHDTRRWKDDLISQVFMDDEAKIIKSIPLSPLPAEDSIIWRGTKNGNFSIQSSYFLEMEKAKSQRGGASRPREEVDWKECWNLKVPCVVKHFLRRALHDLLPTRVNLAKKRVIQDTLCPICAMEEEMVMHILWSCPASEHVWGAGPRRLQKIRGVGNCFPDLFEDIRRRRDTSEL